MSFAIVDLEPSGGEDVLLIIEDWLVAQSITAQLRRAGVQADVVKLPRTNTAERGSSSGL